MAATQIVQGLLVIKNRLSSRFRRAAVLVELVVSRPQLASGVGSYLEWPLALSRFHKRGGADSSSQETGSLPIAAVTLRNVIAVSTVTVVKTVVTPYRGTVTTLTGSFQQPRSPPLPTGQREWLLRAQPPTASPSRARTDVPLATTIAPSKAAYSSRRRGIGAPR